MHLTDRDLQQLANRGISRDEIERQFELFRNPPPAVAVERPCIVGDGILRLDDERRRRLASLFDQAAEAGRFSRFVPASGAATRMFKELFHSDEALQQWEHDGACPNHPFHQTFFSHLGRFAFYPRLAAAMRQKELDPDLLLARRTLGPFLDILLDEDGLNYGRTPKGLIDFHLYGRQARTPMEEHLAETVALLPGGCRSGRVHFTVSPEWQTAFARTAERACNAIRRASGIDITVDFSCQDPATDTIAVNPNGEPVRSADGRLVLRPAGHGALIGNLENMHADLVLIKNIDNVVPTHLQPEVVHWWKVLGGLLVELETQIRSHLQAIDESRTGAAAEAADFLGKTFGYTAPAAGPEAPPRLRDMLDRPLRVCGMVENRGEPGGGPFWTRTNNGVSRQIVEMAQLAADRPQTRELLRQATHFNPVFMACALRDAAGKPHRLGHYVDESAVIITEKSLAGQPVKALERPGLWNGAMAGWNTLFVEIPAAIFQPVKTVNDLLRPGHQPG